MSLSSSKSVISDRTGSSGDNQESDVERKSLITDKDKSKSKGKDSVDVRELVKALKVVRKAKQRNVILFLYCLLFSNHSDPLDAFNGFVGVCSPAASSPP
ncbi:hypothetical protein DICVIV_02054 [Dictyocaulus viviparus]|uniref:Uncharacterized protein n=1 Tax=Dictyocaulus viviparus TaxID=29172 RepID=A0A0D8Y4H0_DICVI|nr:hypothetical protein DICVIV_02054 [Dictyocaulus viviparus]